MTLLIDIYNKRVGREIKICWLDFLGDVYIYLMGWFYIYIRDQNMDPKILWQERDMSCSYI